MTDEAEDLFRFRSVKDGRKLTFAFCMTVPEEEAYIDGGLLRISRAQFTGKDSL